MSMVDDFNTWLFWHILWTWSHFQISSPHLHPPQRMKDDATRSLPQKVDRQSPPCRSQDRADERGLITRQWQDLKFWAGFRQGGCCDPLQHCVDATCVRGTQDRGRAEKEPRISIPVLAVPVSELLAGKNQRICNSLNWFKGVTFTFWIKIYRKNIFPKINSKIYKFSGFFLPEVPIPALPEPESKFLVPSLLAP